MTLSSLAEAARKATKGPWHFDENDKKYHYVDDLTGNFNGLIVPEHESWPEGAICEVWGGNHVVKFNAAYIATLSPERVLAMCAVVEAAQYCFRPGELEASLRELEQELGKLEELLP